MSQAEAITWTAWLALGILWEVRGFVRRSPGDLLTEFKREYILCTRLGSAIVGAFLVWLIWHWLFDTVGLGWEDAVASAVGAIIGILGWYHRFKHDVPG